jgi:hypothetical protein
MSHADELESHAHYLEAEDTECACCHHPWSFHRSWDLRQEQPCDYITDSKVVKGGTLCGCAAFVESGKLA